MNPLGISWQVVAVGFLFAIPVAIVVLLGAASFRRTPPLIFRCRRCGLAFERPAHADFPDACGHCGARDWNIS